MSENGNTAENGPRGQRYTQAVPRERMSHGLCPDCGRPVAMHSDDTRFWMPRACDLTARGVVDRISRYEWETARSAG